MPKIRATRLSDLHLSPKGTMKRSVLERSTHGGTDSDTEPRHDFSSNANALGPNPHVLRAIRAADLSRYCDPHYKALKEQLGAFHAVDPERVVVGAGASELILR